MLQYHISTTTYSTVPLFIRYVLLCVCCILHTITCTNVTISHINNQKVYCSRAYTVYHFVFVVFCTQSLVLLLQYHISTIKLSTVPLFIRYVLLCVCCILHTITCTNVTISHINNQTFYRSCVYTVYQFVFVALYTQSLVLMLQYHISTTKHSTVPLFIRCFLLCVRCILHTITCTNVTISHINNQKFYRSRVYTVYHFVFVVFCTQSLVVMLKYHISTSKHSTVPVFIQYVLLCSLYCTHNHLY
jgi:uncharacterized protein (UPF0332 family)